MCGGGGRGAEGRFNTDPLPVSTGCRNDNSNNNNNNNNNKLPIFTMTDSSLGFLTGTHGFSHSLRTGNLLG